MEGGSSLLMYGMWGERMQVAFPSIYQLVFDKIASVARYLRMDGIVWFGILFFVGSGGYMGCRVLG